MIRYLAATVLTLALISPAAAQPTAAKPEGKDAKPAQLDAKKDDAKDKKSDAKSAEKKPEKPKHSELAGMGRTVTYRTADGKEVTRTFEVHNTPKGPQLVEMTAKAGDPVKNPEAPSEWLMKEIGFVPKGGDKADVKGHHLLGPDGKHVYTVSEKWKAPAKSGMGAKKPAGPNGEQIIKVDSWTAAERPAKPKPQKPEDHKPGDKPAHTPGHDDSKGKDKPK